MRHRRVYREDKVERLYDRHGIDKVSYCRAQVQQRSAVEIPGNRALRRPFLKGDQRNVIQCRNRGKRV